jgi:tetratricopeptide (TPR) repeat protein
MDYSQASKYYQTILDHNDSDLVAIINLGNIFLYQGEKDQATECFKKLFRINPKIFEQDPELAKHLQEQGIWDKVIIPLSVSSTEESEPLSPTKPTEIVTPAQEEQISRISSSRMQDSATTIQGEELTILPSSPSPSSSRSQSSVVQAATPKPLPMKNVAAFTSSAVSEILKRRSSKAEMTDINKQKIHNFILGSLRNEGHNLAEKLLKELPKLGLGRSYIKELQPAIKESRERKEGKEKAESKQQLNINNITLGQRDVYEFTSSNKSKIIIKFDREKIAEALTSKFAGNAVKIMEKIDVELQKKQLAAPHNKSGIKIISDEEVELKIYGTQGIGDIRITGKVESFSYQNTEGCRFAVLNVLTTHKGIEREK